MNKKYFVHQNAYKDCGAACLLSIMKYYGYNTSLDEVSYAVKITNEGTNAYNLINGSRTFGFDGFGSHYTYEEITNNKVVLPIICHTLKDNMYHFIVVYKINKNSLIIMDPSSNKTKISKKDFKNIYLNTAIVIYPVKRIDKLLKHKGIFSFIFEYIKEIKNTTIKTIILSLLVIFLGVIFNYYLLICIDYIIPNFNTNIFYIITTIFLVTLVIKNILLYIREKYLIYIENTIYSKINIHFIRKLFNLPYNFFKTKSSGEIESRLNDLSYFKELISRFIINTSIDLLFTIISLIILLSINYKIFFINVISLVLYLIIVIIFKNSFIEKSEEILISESNYKKTLIDNINSYEINKNLNMINDTNKKLEIRFIDYINKTSSYENEINVESIFKNIIVDIFYIITIFYGIILINNKTISLGEFILFNSILVYFSEPLKNIIDLNHSVVYVKNIYNRINDLFIINIKKELLSYKDIKSNIKISNLSYKINNKIILSNINMTINYQDKVLIYGKSGSGKSTLLKILLKYLDDYKGNIYLNNINIKDISSSIISDNFTYVSQNSYICNDTLENNIIYDRNISAEKYEENIHLCNLDALRDSKIERNNFMIEDNGFNISGGEKQKIILARSLLKDSNYLILDEALSEVDVNEEIDIVKKILDKYKDKTIIYVTHKKGLSNLFNKKYNIERSNRGYE